jgi:hypothetical protein
MTQQSDRDPGHLSTEPEPGPVGQLLRLFLTQLLAVVAIAAVITAVVSWTGAGLDDDVTAAPASTRGAATEAAATDSATPAGSTPASTETPSPETTTSSAPTSTPESSPPQALPRVDVLNQSAPGGSAARTADRLRERGWRIGRVDDFRGNVSETTVYYPPGFRGEARQLRGDLPGSPRVQPGFSTLKDNRLTVILVG